MPSEPLVRSLAGPAQLVLRAASVSVVIVAAAREIRMTIRGSLPNVAKNASDINKLGRITSPSPGVHRRPPLPRQSPGNCVQR